MKSYGTYVVLLTLLSLAGCMPATAPTELKFNPGALAPQSNAVSDTSGQSFAAFKQTVYPLVRAQSCKGCHNSQSSNTSVTPFADPSPEVAFNAIINSRKVSLANPEASRIVRKLADESHNCWSNCADNSAQMLDEVRKWVAMAPVTTTTTGISTSTLRIPQESTAQPAQTEYGTLLLQAEQGTYRSQVVSGRFFDIQDSNALEGKYLELSSLEANPTTSAGRSLNIDFNKYGACKEFEDADLAAATRAIRFMQQRVHIPSGLTNGSGKVVNDGYKPFLTNLSFYIIRPDKRLEYARLLYNNNLSAAANLVLYNGAPTAIAKSIGTILPNTFQGSFLSFPSNLTVFPHFADFSTIINPDGSYKTSGSYTKDDGTQESIYFLFKDGAYSPSPEVLHRKLVSNSILKRDILYKEYKGEVQRMFYDGTTPKMIPNYAYNQFVNASVLTYFSPVVSVQVASADLKYQVSQSGTPLTQANALDCYTLDGSQSQIISAAAANCNGSNPRFFNYIDLFIHPIVNDPAMLGEKTLNFYNSTIPGTFNSLENFAEDNARRVSLNNNQTPQELDSDVIYTGGAQFISPEDDIRNFSTTLHATLKMTRCLDCHAGSNVNIPQFASSNLNTAFTVLKAEKLVNFATPSSSFRSNGMIHNCNGNSTDPRYSCSDAAETALRTALVNAITAWKNANTVSAQQTGAQSFRALARNERLPGRVKYQFKVTSEGLHNVWMKIKNKTGSKINFRILNSSGSAIPYSMGAAPAAVGSCYKWDPRTTIDFWEWGTPGREDELGNIDQKGYVQLESTMPVVPKIVANNRAYFNLAIGTYTLDIIGLSEGLKLDAVGINKVDNMATDSLLAFQPDRRAIDEKNVSDYKRKILRFDLTSKLNLMDGKKAFFEIEVKKEFEGQNFIFRNPRFITSPRSFNLSLKGIKVFINGKWNYPDATYNQLEAVTGDNQVLTYAPLVALTTGSDDDIHFQFDKLSVTNESLTPIYPKGSAPAQILDRQCANLEYFRRNVKPILMNAKVVLKQDLDDYNKDFPGSPRGMIQEPKVYNCISCHTVNHPYFKMSTFTNDAEFCREAMSRINFQDFYQSTVIRGINGTGNHPKFVFIEKFVNDTFDNFKIHDRTQDYMLNRYVNPSLIASNLVPGPRMIWSKDDIVGTTIVNYSQLTTQLERDKIAKAGLYKKVIPETVKMEVLTYPWYSIELHNDLLFNDDGNSTLNNVLSAYDVIKPDCTPACLASDRRMGPFIYKVGGFDLVTGIPITNEFNGIDPSGITPLCTGGLNCNAGTKIFIPNAEPAFDSTKIDYISTTSGPNTKLQMDAEYEVLRSFYRDKIINWMRLENEARLNGN